MKNDIHNKISILRSIERLILSDRFAELLNEATPGVKDFVISCIGKYDLNSLKLWMKEPSVKSLRETARRLGIKQYSFLPKNILKSEIEKHDKSKLSSASPGFSQGNA